MFEVIIPKIEANTEEVTIVRWLKNEGDKVEKGEPLLAIETAKTVMDIEAEQSGFLRKILSKEGEKVPVLKPVALLE
ncbi:biotin attachment protein [Candidatus Woesearchaeota archaeon]|nr:biotin attachment protein [Candidatus Woesearchaeota archaeon]